MESLEIQGTVLTPSSGEAYTLAIQRNSDLAILRPAYVVQPRAATDIPPVLAYAAAQSPPLEVAVKGGGAHSATWASSAGGVVIDLGLLNTVTVADDKQSVIVQGGALWGDVYEKCREAGVDVVGGPLWFVGVSGYLTGGGYGPLSGARGLAVDNILAATVVLADGRIVKTSVEEEPELFWAIRGGGGQFGIVVEFVLRAFPPAGPFTIGVLVYPGTEVAAVLKLVQEWKTTQTPNERLSLMFTRSPPHFKPGVIILPWVAHDADGTRATTSLAPLRSGPPKPLFEKLTPAPDALAVSHAADALAKAPRRLTIRGALVADLWTDVVLGAWERWRAFTEENADARASVVMWDVTHPGKIAEVAAGATAVAARAPHHWVLVQGRNTDPATDAATRAFVASTVEYIRAADAAHTGAALGVLVNFAQGDESPADMFGVNLPRLRKAKARYDPGKVWRRGIVIEPDFA